MSPTDRLNAAPRCRAKSKRTGKPCRAPALTGWKVCRFHGARGGAPKGPANGAYRTGQHTKEAKTARQQVRHLLKQSKALTALMHEGGPVNLPVLAMEDIR
ncbi:MAG: hypothetical protein AB7F09_06630 [Parvibaculaceae bacterium]